jgi:hypothetical protein
MGQQLCGVTFNATLDPRGGKLQHIYRCDRPKGHPEDGPHAGHRQSLPSASLTIQSRLTLWARHQEAR